LAIIFRVLSISISRFALWSITTRRIVITIVFNDNWVWVIENFLFGCVLLSWCLFKIVSNWSHVIFFIIVFLVLFLVSFNWNIFTILEVLWKLLSLYGGANLPLVQDCRDCVLNNCLIFLVSCLDDIRSFLFYLILGLNLLSLLI
jgi:hypothetical protein